MRSVLLLILFLAGNAWAVPVWARSRVAVQPFGGAETQPLRKLVARIIGKHGFRVLTSLPAVTGTSQYPGLAKNKRIAAFVVGEVVVRGKHTSLSFLVWQGIDGSVVGRWELSGKTATLSRTLGKDFWKHLGPAIDKAMAPPSDRLPPAPPMRINAGTPVADSADGY